MPKIRFRRGPEANLPTLNEGEPGFTTDTEEFFVGSKDGNIQFAKQSDLTTINTQVTNNTNTLNSLVHTDATAELVNARGTYSILGDRLNGVDSSFAKSALQTGINITNYGAVADGATPCDTAFTNAKTAATNSKIYFPQNATNNAVYYFTSSPTLDGLVISADAGVQLSFPTTNYLSFKTATFANDISIVSRDRNNTGKQLKSDISKLMYQSTQDVGDYGVTSYTNITQSELSFTRRQTDSLTPIDLSTKVFYNSGKIYFDNTQLDFATSKLNCVEVTPVIGTLYTGTFDIETTISTAYRAGIIISSSDNTFVFFSSDSLKNFYSGANTGTWSESTLGTAPSGAYAIYNNASLMMSFRQIDANNVEIYVNGTFITKINKTGISKIGFCYNSQSNCNLMYIMNLVKSSVNKMTYGNDINVAVFGDSISFGEGANVSWADFLPQILEGKRGIAQVKVTNKAHSGDKSADQWTVMQGTTLTGFNVVLVMVGTNDIQQNVAVSTYETNITNMINAIKSAGAIPIFGIPPMFTTPAETGYGYSTSYYYNGAIYRSTIMRVCAANNVLIADVQSELGKIGADNVQLRDNLHPQTRGQVVVSKCFAKAIMKALTTDITPSSGSSGSTSSKQTLTLQNSWLNYGSGYTNAQAVKDGNGNVTLNGLIKSGTITNGTVIATLPSGYAPLSSSIFNVSNSNGSGAYDFAVLNVASNGNITISKCTYNNWLSLDGIKFNIT